MLRDTATQYSPSIAEQDLAQVQRSYSLREDEPQEITNFLAEFPGLVPLLSEVASHVPAYFPDSSLALMLLTDPDAAHDSRHLIALVGTNLPTNEAFDKLEALDLDWWLERSRQIDGRLSLDVELR